MTIFFVMFDSIETPYKFQELLEIKSIEAPFFDFFFGESLEFIWPFSNFLNCWKLFYGSFKPKKTYLWDE